MSGSFIRLLKTILSIYVYNIAVQLYRKDCRTNERMAPSHRFLSTTDRGGTPSRGVGAYYRYTQTIN